MRKYFKSLNPDNGDIFTVNDFKCNVENGGISDYDGFGYWVKDNLRSDDEVFSTEIEDATHVIWFNN